MKGLLYRICRLPLCVVLAIIITVSAARAEELFLEPVVEGYAAPDVVFCLEEHGRYYLSIEDLADLLQFQLIQNGGIHGSFLGKSFKVDPSSLSAEDYLRISGQDYFSFAYYEKLFPLRFEVNHLDMQLKISSDEDLPVIQKLQAADRRRNFVPPPPFDGFKNYEFDNRLWSVPVVDFSYRKNLAVSDYNGDNERHFDNNYFQFDSGMLLGGFDAYASVFGDSEQKGYAPRARFTLGRTFLDEPKNALNLTSFEAGDVTGFNSTLFNNSANGRGLYASSFKDLVLSADKTIDINGPLSSGWEVELYQNGQLIGFRQAGLNGRYQFSNIPVNYGLNAFKLVFYGPYGEIQTEERNYYSGTSPVKAGEFGYTLNAYQRDRYLIEENEPFKNPSSKPTTDFTGYYGVNDNLTLIAGLTQTPNLTDDEMMNFGNLGAQLIWDGASFQYNSMYDFTDNLLGHHFDVQGDIYVGSIFASYDYYGEMQAPIAYYNDEYLKDTLELRLTGNLPYLSLPYFLSYEDMRTIDGDRIQEFHTRLSPNFMSYYNVSVENIWSKDKNGTADDVVLLLQAQYNQLGFHTYFRYRVAPEASMQSVGQQVDYRWNKNTYFQVNWDHNFKTSSGSDKNIDTLSLSAGRLFDFGGLTLSLSADTEKNASISLTYNMSFGKVPDRNAAFTNAQSKMSERSAIYARITDENNKPVSGTKLQVSGLQDPVTTDENGEALIADIAPYEKTLLTVDVASIEDLSLVPEYDQKKLVLRPGTVLPLNIRFSHKGAVEGYIASELPAFDYKVALVDDKGKQIAVQTPEEDGSFIFDDVSFGRYKLVISDEKNPCLKEQEIDLRQDYYSLPRPIKV